MLSSIGEIFDPRGLLDPLKLGLQFWIGMSTYRPKSLWNRTILLFVGRKFNMSSFLDICRTCLFFTISSAHIVSRHKGVRLTLAQIPSYINVCGANRSMSKIIHRCAVFRSRRGKQLVVPTGPLHMNSAPSASFERIAVDGFGPFHLKNGRKFWGIVVVCLSSRCVRITVLGNSTLSSAIPSLMFVWNSVGRPNLVITDNGSHSSFHIYENPRSLSVYNPHNILCIVTHCFVSAWS